MIQYTHVILNIHMERPPDLKSQHTATQICFVCNTNVLASIYDKYISIITYDIYGHILINVLLCMSIHHYLFGDFDTYTGRSIWNWHESIHIYNHTHLHAYVYQYINIHINTNAYNFVYVDGNIYLYTLWYIFVYTFYLYLYIHTCTGCWSWKLLACINTCMFIRTFTYTYVSMHISIHIVSYIFLGPYIYICGTTYLYIQFCIDAYNLYIHTLRGGWIWKSLKTVFLGTSMSRTQCVINITRTPYIHVYRTMDLEIAQN